VTAARRFVVAPAAVGQRLDLFLAEQVGSVSRSQLARQIGQAAVTVNGEAGVPSRKLRAGDVVSWAPPAVVATEIAAEDLPLAIVHEDRWLVVIDKPAGLVVHPAPGHEAGTLVNALLAHCRDLRGIGGELRPGIVHRIDKDTSGLLVVAKDDQTMNALGAAFKAHAVERVYDALVVGKPPGADGIGLNNVRERLAVQFEGRARLTAGPQGTNQGAQWRSEITLPEIQDSPDRQAASSAAPIAASR